MVEVPAKAVYHVRVGLAQGVRRAGVIVARADLGKTRRSGDARRCELDRLKTHWVLDLSDSHPQVRRQPGGRLAQLGRGGPLILIAPAPMLVPTNLHSARVYAQLALFLPN